MKLPLGRKNWIIGILVGLVSSGSNSLLGAETLTFAGTGNRGYSGDGGPAIEAELNQPFGVVKGPDENVYICDTFNHCIRKVTPGGIISTVAGIGTPGYTGDGGLAVEAQLNQPYEIRVLENGDLYFVEMINCVVRKVSADTGKISTVAGTGSRGYSGDGGRGVLAEFRSPHSIQFGADGLLYICDIGNNRIRKLDLNTGIVSHFAGSGRGGVVVDGSLFAMADLNGPRAIDFDRDGNMLLALREGNAVYRLDVNAGTLSHLAGTGNTGFTGNGGPAKLATLSGPKGIAIGPTGNIYLADTESHSVRMIDMSNGNLELIAGTGEAGDGPDGEPLASRMDRLHGIFVDANGEILIGDTLTNRVRLIRE